MNQLYPLKFAPILKDRIWGGNKLNEVFGRKDSTIATPGESWDLSGVEGSVSVVTNGFLKGNDLNELIEVYMADLVGESVYEQYGNEFPLLIKLLDAAQDLSIQVHPNDALAQERHNCNGKSEMWYVLQADKGSKLISGFNSAVSKSDYLNHLEKGTLQDILGFHTVKTGDVFNIPAGKVHAIGSGILIAEIQQTSDITYRIYDFDRRDSNGNLRELHTELAVDAIDFKSSNDAKQNYETKPNQSVQLVNSPYFQTNIIDLWLPIEKDYFEIDSFIIYICVEGAFEIDYADGHPVSVQYGETVLLPAELNNVTLVPSPRAKILEIYVP